MKKIFKSKTGIAIIATALITTGIGLQQLFANSGNSPSSVTSVSETVYSDGGFMTGGGNISNQGEKVTYSFKIHSNDGRDNNSKLEISWGKHKFRMDNLISSVTTNDPGIKSDPPSAGFNTISGSGSGQMDKNSGYTVEFKFVDAGEPGTSDWSSITIKDNSNITVLEASGYVQAGNSQAH